MDEELLQFMAVAAKIATMVDGGNSVLLHTNEMSPQQTMKLFGLKGKAAWWMGKPNKLEVGDIPEIDADIKEVGKSPSTRLRSVLYILWDQQADKQKYPEFEVYYRAKMELIIEGIKEKLNWFVPLNVG